jgi:uncharacterized protein
MNLEGKKILITGASSGIGFETAKELMKGNAQLILVARDVECLKIAVKYLLMKYPNAPEPTYKSCDVSDNESVIELRDFCLTKYRGVDILINNAGIGVYGSFDLTSNDDFHNIMNVNFFGAVNCTKAFLPSFKLRNSGIIANMSSLAGIHGVPYLSAYSASKAAIVAFSESLRAELKDKNISIINIYPGYTATDFFKNEKLVGGAVRPEGPYYPAERVAKAIVKAIESEKPEKIISLNGILFSFVAKFFPRYLNHKMKDISNKLKNDKEINN